MAYNEATLLSATLTDYTVQTALLYFRAGTDWDDTNFTSSCMVGLQESKFLVKLCHMSFLPQFKSVVSLCLHLPDADVQLSTDICHRYQTLSVNSKVKFAPCLTIHARNYFKYYTKIHFILYYKHFESTAFIKKQQMHFYKHVQTHILLYLLDRASL